MLKAQYPLKNENAVNHKYWNFYLLFFRWKLKRWPKRWKICNKIMSSDWNSMFIFLMSGLHASRSWKVRGSLPQWLEGWVYNSGKCHLSLLSSCPFTFPESMLQKKKKKKKAVFLYHVLLLQNVYKTPYFFLDIVLKLDFKVPISNLILTKISKHQVGHRLWHFSGEPVYLSQPGLGSLCQVRFAQNQCPPSCHCSCSFPCLNHLPTLILRHSFPCSEI